MESFKKEAVFAPFFEKPASNFMCFLKKAAPFFKLLSFGRKLPSHPSHVPHLALYLHLTARKQPYFRQHATNPYLHILHTTFTLTYTPHNPNTQQVMTSV